MFRLISLLGLSLLLFLLSAGDLRQVEIHSLDQPYDPVQVAAEAEAKARASEPYALDFKSRWSEPAQDCWASRLHQKLDRGSQLSEADLAMIPRSPAAVVAYPESFSHAADQDVVLHIAGGLSFEGTALAGYEIQDAVDHSLVLEKDLTSENIPLERRPVRSFYRGADFRTTLTLPGGTLAPGVYKITLIDDVGGRSDSVFVNVRASVVGKASPVVVSFPTLTLQSYNFAGGGSLYYIHAPTSEGTIQLTAERQLYAASLQRPDFNQGYYHTPEITLAFLRTLRRAGVAYRCVDSLDLHRQPKLALKDAKVLVLTGHDEYWTAESRAAVDAYVRAGGHLANFAGNALWWQVTIKDEIIYLDRAWTDPLGQDPDVANLPFAGTGPCSSDRIGANPERLLGVTYYLAGLPIQTLEPEQAREHGISAEIYERSGAVEVIEPTHPVFEGLGIRAGYRWGGDTQLLHQELDGVPLVEDNLIDPAIRDMFPERLRILATAEVFNGYRLTMGGKPFHGLTKVGIFVEVQPFPGGGRVLSFGSIGCGASLKHRDPTTVRVFLNSIQYLQKIGTAPW